MSEMEPDIRQFLLKIASSISMGLLWMLVNTTLGIGYNLGFFQGMPTWKNYVFYAWLIFSFVLVLIYLKRKWKT